MKIAGGTAVSGFGDQLTIIQTAEISFIKETIKKLRYFGQDLERNDKPIPKNAYGTYRLEREFCAQFIPIKEFIARGCQESVLTTMYVDIFGAEALGDIEFYTAFKENIYKLVEIIQNKITL